MKCYDYIIAGSGCAGLSIAYYLATSKLSGKKVLIVDRVEKSKNDRTWCFWTAQPTTFDGLVRHSWQEIIFADDSGMRTHTLRQHQYALIRGIDFYKHTKQVIAQHPNFEWLQGEITQLSEDESGAYIRVNGEQIRANWVFNSCFDWQTWYRRHTQAHFLLQHFMGWVIETPEASFEPGQATLMDFGTQQHHDARFFYILPFSSRRALVEYTIFSKHILQPIEYQIALENYLREQWKIEQFCIVETEFGVIPMSDAPIPPSPGKHIISVGTVGGAVKPTTGYAFLNIQKQAQQLVKQLEKGQIPHLPSKQKTRFRFYDRLLLNILTWDGNAVKPIFSHLFRNNPIERIFAFLDERSTLAQELLIFSMLPFRPFLKALYRLYFLKTGAGKRRVLLTDLNKKAS